MTFKRQRDGWVRAIGFPLALVFVVEVGVSPTLASNEDPANTAASRSERSLAALGTHLWNVQHGLASGDGADAAIDTSRVPKPIPIDGSMATDEAPIMADVVTQLPRPEAGLGDERDPQATPPAAKIEIDPTATPAAPPIPTKSSREIRGFDPATSVEDLTQRDRFTTTFLNVDGTSTLVMSTMPTHFQDQTGAWRDVDNRIVADAHGRLTNAANEWSVTFEPMEPGRGVGFDTTDGSFRFVADGALAVAPTVEPDGNSVRYRDVIPDADLVYKVTGAGVEELLILKSAIAQPSLSFTVSGAQFDDVPAGLDARGDGIGRRLLLSAPETFLADGRPVDVSQQVLTARDLPNGKSSIVVGLKPEYVRGLGADKFPVVVDPNVGLTTGASGVWSWARYSNNGNLYAAYTDGYVRTGNPYLSSTSTVRWRSVVAFPYSAALGASVVGATITVDADCCTASGTQPLNTWWADEIEWHYATSPRVARTDSYGAPSNPLAWTNSWSAYASDPMNIGVSSTSGSLNVLYNAWTRTGVSTGALLMTGNEAAAYTYKKFAVSLALTYNRWPSTPTLTGTANGHTLTFGAASPGTDLDGDTVQYRHYVRSGSTLLYDSNWVLNRQASYTAPSAYRGGSLTFETIQWDGVCNLNECHTTSGGVGSWNPVGNLIPSSGSPTTPAANSSDTPNVSPLTSSRKSYTFSGTVGSDVSPENDPLVYRFFFCPDSGCSSITWMNGWTSASAGASVSTSYAFTSYGDKWWGIATSDTSGSTYARSTPRKFTVINTAPPAATTMTPNKAWLPNRATPLSVSAVVDANGDPLTYKFRLCNQPSWVSDTTKCIESGYQSGLSWTPPATNPMAWSTTNYWWVVTNDGTATTESGTKANVILQRSANSHPSIGFGVQPNMRPTFEVNPGNGNLVYTAHDLTVASPTQPLVVDRAYNSSSSRVGGFGPGWSYSWDFKLDVDSTAGSEGVGVTFPDGRVAFFGRNANGTYAIQLGDAESLAANPGGVPAQISAIGSAAYAMTDHALTKYYFTSTGTFLGLVDLAGRVITVTASGTTQTITDASSGRQLFVTWDGTPGPGTASRIVSARTVLIAADGNTPIEWKYYYDGTGSKRLQRACDPRNNATNGYCYVYSYGTNGLLTSVVLPRGNTQLAITYDGNNRVSNRKDGLLNAGWTFTYATNVSFQGVDSNGAPKQVVAARRTTITDPRGNSDVVDFDQALHVIHTDNLAGRAEQFAYDDGGNLAGHTVYDTSFPPTGGTQTELTVMQWDGDVTSYTAPDGSTVGGTFEPRPDGPNGAAGSNAIRGSTSSAGPSAPTTIQVDAAGDPTSISTPGVGTETISYTTGTEPAVGQPGLTQPRQLIKTYIGTDGIQTNYGYTAAGDLASLASTGLTITYTYDEIGRVTSETQSWDSQTAAFTYTYNKLGQQLTLTEPRVRNEITGRWHQARTTWAYDPNTNPIQISIADIEPPAGGFTPDPPRTTIAEYDNADRSWRLTDPEQHVTWVEFDPNSNITKYTDPNGHATTTTYDSESRQRVVTRLGFTDPTSPATPVRDVVISSTVYDHLGRVDTQTDALGHSVQSTYYANGKLRTKTLLNYHQRIGSPINVVLEEYHYDAVGRLDWSKTGNGTALTQYTYDPYNRLATTVQVNSPPTGYVARNNTTTYVYQSMNTERLASITTTDGVTSTETRYGYDSSGRVTHTIIENGTNDLDTAYGYDSRGIRTSVTSPNGSTTTTSYDLLGRVWRITNPTATVETFNSQPASLATTALSGYDTFGDISHTQDAGGSVSTFTYDRNGQRVGTTYPAYTPPGASVAIAPTETNVYDAAGNIEHFVDRRGNTTDFVYDTFDRISIVRPPAATAGGTRGEIWTRYDDLGNVTWTQNEIGAVTEHSYDDLSRVRTTTDVVRNGTATPDRFTATTDYDWHDQPIITLDAYNDAVWSAVYSPLGEMLGVTDGSGNTTKYEYDVRHNPVKITDAGPTGNYSKNTYDLAGRLTDTGRYTAANVRVAGQTYTYDSNGNPTSLTQAVNGTTNAVTTYGYDALDRLTSVIEPINASTSITTTYGYDALGQLTHVRDGRLNDWWTTYNSWGLEESRIEPSTTGQSSLADRTFTKVYEPGGNVAREDQPGGVSISRSIDNLGRVTSEYGGVAGGSRGFSYDLTGRVTAITSGPTSINLAYTDRNQLQAVAGSAGNSSFTYDSDGRMSHRYDAAGDTAYTWTIRSQLQSVSEPLTGSTRTYTWNPDGTLNKYVATSGSSNTTRGFTWDAARRLTSDTLTNPAGQSIRAKSYTYDPRGNVLTEATSPSTIAGAGTDTYTYDWSSRLTSWTTSATGATTNYVYDNAGNLTASGAITNTYDARNRQTANGSTTKTWTARGTLASSTISGVSTSYSFDGLGRMLAAGSSTYTYDGLDRINTRNGTPFTYSGLSNQPTNDGVSTVSRDPSGGLLAERQGANSVNLVLDPHGDVSATVSNTGAIVDSLAMDPWGTRLTANGPNDLRWGFQASYTDPTSGLIDMGARWYATSAAFASRDSWAGRAATPISLNRYAYANGNPVTNLDPTGHACMSFIDGICASSLAQVSSQNRKQQQITAAQKEDQRKVQQANTLIRTTTAPPAAPTVMSPTAWKQYESYHVDMVLTNFLTSPTATPNQIAAALQYTSTGAVVKAVIDVANQGDLNKRDGNFSSNDIAKAASGKNIATIVGQMGLQGDAAAFVTKATQNSAQILNGHKEVWEALDQDITLLDKARGIAKVVAVGVVGFATFAGCEFAGTVATGGTNAGGGVTVGCAVLAGAAVRATGTLLNGGSAADALHASTDPRGVAIDIGTVGILQGFSTALSSGAIATSRYLTGTEPAAFGATNTVDDAMAGVRAAGAQGEAAAGIIKNTQRIPSLSGSAPYRIPDGLGNGVLSEVKNVSSLSYSSQLRDFAVYAQQEGLAFNLYVRGSTTLSGPLQAAVDNGTITLIRSLPG